ncbi:zinc-ribbon domain-containing protein [Microbaculum sp. FT89]|uniref:zinc-ribbon domain-containing protein n=1 Tax=Microbaculum sp. FT89 TaxID=3447298 RepID=UPI003F52AE3C
MYCTQCGAKNDDSAKYCTQCGQSIEAPQPQNSGVTEAPSDASYKRPRRALYYALLPVWVFLGTIVFWGFVNIIGGSSGNPSKFVLFVNNTLVPLLFSLSLLALPIFIIYGIVVNNRHYDGTIKCGNCNYVGMGAPGRSTWAQVLVWIAFFFFWPITLIYYVVTRPYVCPKCGSSFVALKDKSGAFGVAKAGNTTLVVTIAVFASVIVIGILASVILASLNSARELGEKARLKANISSMREKAEIYYTNNENDYTGFCSETIVRMQLQESTSASGGHYVCNDTTNGYVISVPLGEGRYFCVDAWGNALDVRTMVTNQTACPPASTLSL